MRNSQLKPWLNKDSSVKSDAALRKAGQNWPSSVWEAYLSTLEVGRREEDVLSPAEMDALPTEAHISVMFAMASGEKHQLLNVVLDACIRELTPRQRSLVVGRYWEGKTITEMAANMGVSKQTISKTMKKALANLKANFTNPSFQRRVIFAQKMAAA